MDTATLNLSYSQILGLAEQLPAQSRLRMSRVLARKTTKDELNYLMNAFKNDEITEDEVRDEVKQVRQELYESRQKEKSDH
jgi:hypothetical protein